MGTVYKKESAVGMMDEFICSLVEGNEWIQIMLTDPWICTATAEKDELLEKARAVMSQQAWLDLEAAINNLSCAVTNAAILYGIHVADSIRAISACPELVSKRVVDRMAKRRKTA